MSVIQEIVQHKRMEVAEIEARIPLKVLKSTERALPVSDFASSLSQPGMQLIAEIKPKSPSEGVIRSHVDPALLAQAFEASGAAAISVLTDTKYFGGDLDSLRQAKLASSLPVLRKDFILTEYQVYESYLAGADAILLIVDALPTEELIRLHHLSDELGMATLVEIYAPSHADLFDEFIPPVVGVNARDLRTLNTTLQRGLALISILPEACVKVAESGVCCSEDLSRLSDVGYDAALLGTVLMKAESPGALLATFLRDLRS